MARWITGSPCRCRRSRCVRQAERRSNKPAKKKFKAYPIGDFHIDIAKLQTAEGKLFLFVDIDRTSKSAFVKLANKANRVTASALLTALIAAVPYKMYTMLIDNGIQFHFPPRYAEGPTAQFITHMFGMHPARTASSVGLPRSIIPGPTDRSRE